MRQAESAEAAIMLAGCGWRWPAFGPLPMYRAPKPPRKGDHDRLDPETDRQATAWLADTLTRTVRRVRPDAPRWTPEQTMAAFGPAHRRRLWLAHQKRERKAALRRERGGL